MRRRSRTARALAALTLVVLVLGAGACGGRDSSPERRAPVVTVVQDDAELLHRSPQRTAATLDDLRDLGVDWVRVTAGWSVIAPDSRSDRRPPGFDAADPDAYPHGAWDALDRLHRMARARGLRLAVDIAFWAPRWAVRHPAADRSTARERDGIDPAAYADFAEAVARRYPDTAAFTIWNEPNHNVFLLPQWERDTRGRWQPASPRVYRDMLRAAVPRVRAAAPKALVLIGATSSVGAASATTPDQRMAPLTFARALACVDARLQPDPSLPGCRDFRPLPGDGWSHHPYSVDLAPDAHDPLPETARMGDLDRLTTLLDRLHAAGRTQRRLPVYDTEYGYQTNPPDPTQPATLADQARWLAEAEQHARSLPEVRSTSQFLVRDLPERPGDDARTRWRDYQSGLRFEDGRAKPARAAYALPLVVRPVAGDPGRLALWGLVRRGTGSRPATVRWRPSGGGAWRTLGTWRTRPDGTFTATVAADATGTFRLVAGGRSGALVRVTR